MLSVTVGPSWSLQYRDNLNGKISLIRIAALWITAIQLDGIPLITLPDAITKI